MLLIVYMYTSVYHSCLIGHGIYGCYIVHITTAFFFVCREMFR
jgi:hypothetical protein